MKIITRFVIAFSLLAFSAGAYSASTKEELLELKEQVAEMRQELAEIKTLLEEGARAPAPTAPPGFREQTVSIEDAVVKGDENAPVTIIEYSDYQCPYCARNYREVMPLIQSEYVDTGKVKFVMREFPLTSIHPNAMNASKAALCAGDQDRYWDMHNLLFENQRQLDAESLNTHAASLELNTDEFKRCMEDTASTRRVQADMASGARLGMRGTPGFYIGHTDPDNPDKVHLTVAIRGAQGIDQFRASLNDLLDAEG